MKEKPKAFRREGTTFIRTMPKSAGRVVAMTTFNGELFIATENRIYKSVEGKRLQPLSIQTK